MDTTGNGKRIVNYWDESVKESAKNWMQETKILVDMEREFVDDVSKMLLDAYQAGSSWAFNSVIDVLNQQGEHSAQSVQNLLQHKEKVVLPVEDAGENEQTQG